MFRRLKLARAGLVRATARAIVRAVHRAEHAASDKHVTAVRAVLTLSGLPFLARKTYIISIRPRKTMFSSPKKTLSLQDVIKQQDHQEEVFRRVEAERQQDQLKAAQCLLAEIRPLLDPRIILDVTSEIRMAPIGAMTYLVFRVPADLEAVVTTEIRVCRQGAISVEVYSAANSNYQRMLEDLAFIVRGFRGVCKRLP